MSGHGSDGIDNRLREVEKTSATVMVTLVDMKSDIHEVKQMFQKFLLDSSRISELAAKVDNIDRLENKYEDLHKKYDILNNDFRALHTQHSMCQSTRGRSDQLMQDLRDRMIAIELAVTSLTNSKTKVTDTIWDWLKKGAASIFILLMLLILLHIKDLNFFPIQDQQKPVRAEEKYKQQYPEYFIPQEEQMPKKVN